MADKNQVTEQGTEQPKTNVFSSWVSNNPKTALCAAVVLGAAGAVGVQKGINAYQGRNKKMS